MLMSPSLIGMAKLSLMPWKNGVLSIDGKYVGKQFLDNSMREELAVPAYFVAGLSAGHTFDLPVGKLAVSAYVNNLLNNLYYAAGWRWESYNEDSGRIDTGIGVYPQAPRNFMIKLSYSF
jgi:iron complex outermembrane receptor protein